MRDLAIYGLTLISHGIAFLLGVCLAVWQIRKTPAEPEEHERFR